MQLLLIRNAKPQSDPPPGGTEPNLSYDGNELARRLPDALSKFSLARIVSSPQLHARQTAAPVASQLGLTVDVDERLAEFDRGRGRSDEDIAARARDELADDAARTGFVERVTAAIRDIVAEGENDQTVAVFTHAGVINAVVHDVIKTERLLSVEVDYAGLTRVRASADGTLSIASINGTDHVWDILYRTQWWSEEH